jgi:hypothetical protein
VNGFNVDADRLSAQAGEFPNLADRAGTIHRELSTALGEAGPCWGSDSVGQSFAAAHVSPSETTLGTLGSLPERLGSVGTRFADSSAAYRRQEATGVEYLNSADDR